MNVYDFDGTIYRGDSSVDFYRFVMKRHPAILRRLPSFLAAALRHKAGKCTTKALKENFFSFLADLPDPAAEAEAFWETGSSRIMDWYRRQQREDDVIISASPEFLLKIPCKALGVTLIATKVDPGTGRFESENCKGAEKVKRFREVCPEGKIGEFYSDSRSDAPLAELAEQAFLVNKGNKTAWS